VNHEPIEDETLEGYLDKRGFINRICGPLIRSIRHSWQMYPLGFLFGLGFDTATEVALLGLSIMAGNQGFPSFLIILLPLMFVSGMSLLDTLDGILMIWCYGWAFVHPIRKIYYNMTVTLVSVLVAFIVGSIEVLSILQESLNLQGPFWDGINKIDFGILGGVIIGLFVFSLAFSTIFYRCKGYDRIGEEREIARQQKQKEEQSKEFQGEERSVEEENEETKIIVVNQTYSSEISDNPHDGHNHNNHNQDPSS